LFCKAQLMHASENAVAFGAPGIEPRWTSSAKEGVGMAHGASNSGRCSEIGASALIHAQQREVVNPQFDFSDDTFDSGGMYRPSRSSRGNLSTSDRFASLAEASEVDISHFLPKPPFILRA